MLSLVPSLVVLGLAALAAAQLARYSSSPTGFAAERQAASRALALATIVQSAHFAEEWMSGFHVRFPALFGLEPMPLSFFVGFNLAWIAIWFASVSALRRAKKPAFFAAWFLAIAGMVNGIAHPAMAVVSGGYFPGLISSPFIGLVCVLLWKRLRSATSSRQGSFRN